MEFDPFCHFEVELLLGNDLFWLKCNVSDLSREECCQGKRL